MLSWPEKLELAPGLRPYSGRYTFVTRYKPILEGDLLRTFTGHVDEAMPSRYHQPFPIEQMKRLQGARRLLNAADRTGGTQS